MDFESAHEDPHYVNRSQWLRAAVLGANDGIVSISALVVGVAAANSDPKAISIAGTAGLVAGAMSMAAGEYVSVSSQSDTERADIARERAWIRDHAEEEETELALIYESRGLSPATAKQVARELTEHDALGAHVRDELGLSETLAAKPLQAALTSAVTFAAAGAIPLLAAVLGADGVVLAVSLATVLALALLGALAARAGGAPLAPSVARVVIWGLLAIGLSAAVGKLFGIAV